MDSPSHWCEVLAGLWRQELACYPNSIRMKTRIIEEKCNSG